MRKDLNEDKFEKKNLMINKFFKITYIKYQQNFKKMTFDWREYYFFPHDFTGGLVARYIMTRSN